MLDLIRIHNEDIKDLVKGARRDCQLVRAPSLLCMHTVVETRLPHGDYYAVREREEEKEGRVSKGGALPWASATIGPALNRPTSTQVGRGARDILLTGTPEDSAGEVRVSLVSPALTARLVKVVVPGDDYAAAAVAAAIVVYTYVCGDACASVRLLVPVDLLHSTQFEPGVSDFASAGPTGSSPKDRTRRYFRVGSRCRVPSWEIAVPLEVQIVEFIQDYIGLPDSP
ncbi:hypothetical protein X777_15937 [Ooceraea biroi]|uniref:Uncharacterized protein n=1 Tax=Ooceraea biroi TaxID=2015173 RepID=A0A026WTK9_OOCBI|nr:hypothetical protein X777_15937 [Ooceraea biroi]